MSYPIVREFEFSDGVVHDATLTETSIELDSCYDYTWSITPLADSLSGATPNYTLEVSNDGVTWFEYNKDSTNVSVDDALDDVHLAFTKIRIVHDGTGTSGGTITYKFIQKKNG